MNVAKLEKINLLTNNPKPVSVDMDETIPFKNNFKLLTADETVGKKNDSYFTKKKSHLLNEILEDSDYDKDPTESSLPVFKLLASPNNTYTPIVLDESDNASTSLHQGSKNSNTSTPLCEVHRNTDELDSTSAPSRPGSKHSDISAFLCLFNEPAGPTLPPCFNDMDTI